MGFFHGVIAGAIMVMLVMLIFRFMRGDGRDLSAPPNMAPPRPRNMPGPLPPLTPISQSGQKPEYDPKAVAAIADALSRGQKIEAIKHLREATGLGLAEAKTAVEDMERKLRG